MKEKGVDIDNLDICYGTDIGTDIHDINLRLSLIKKFPNIKYTIGAGPWQLSQEENIDYIASEIKKEATKKVASFLKSEEDIEEDIEKEKISEKYGIKKKTTKKGE